MTRSMAFLSSTAFPAFTSATADGSHLNISSPAAPGSDQPSLPFSKTGIGLIIEALVVPVVLGNILVLISIYYHKKILVTDVFLFSLSLADVIVGVFPLQILAILKYFMDILWSKALCDIFVMSLNSLRFVAGFTIALIALERTYLIVFPLWYHIRVTTTKAKTAVAIIWMLSFFLGLLPVIGVGHSGFNNGQCRYQFYFLGTTNATVLLTTAFLLLLTVLICFITIKLFGEKFIRRQQVMAEKSGKVTKNMPKTSSGKTKTDSMDQKRTSFGTLHKTKGVKQVQQLTRMMAVLIAFYYISFFPVLISNVVILVQKKTSSVAVVIAVGGLSMVYSLCNPVLYGKMSPRYLRGYKLVIGNVLGVCNHRPRSWSASSISQSNNLRNGTSISEINTEMRKRTASRQANLEIVEC